MKYLVGVGLVLLFVVGVMLLPSGETGPSMSGEVEQETARTAADPGTSSPETAASPPGVETPVASRTEAAADPKVGAFPVEGQVVDERDAPLGDVTVSLTLLTTADADWEPAFQVDDWGALERVRFVETTGADGRFRFPLAEEHAGSSFVVWATRVGRVSALAEGAVYDGQPALRLVLPMGRGLEVEVVDGDGEPLPGALVEQWGTVDPEAQSDETEARASRGWAHTAVTGPDGRAKLAELPGKQVLVAHHGELRSEPWCGEAPATVRLRVVGSFQLSGTVSLPDWSHLEYEGERRLTFSALRGRVPQVLASLRGVEAGTFGPVRLPRVPGATAYRVRLEGSPIIPLEVDLDVPAAGERVQVELDAQLGIRLWLLVHDRETGDPVPTARARVEWIAPDHVAPTGHVERAAMPSGHINVWSLPEGQVAYTVSAPGYVPQRGPWITLPLPEDRSYLTELQRGAPLSGRVVHDGQPVEHFEVAFWQGNLEESRVLEGFSSKDGTFEFEAVPLGDLWLAASSAKGVTFAPVAVRVTASGVDDVVIELKEPRFARGKVVETGSGEPIPGASVQPYVQGAFFKLFPWGRPLRSDAEGAFGGFGFVPGLNLVAVSAPGFEEVTRSVNLDPTGDSDDLGILDLGRPGKLEIRLVGEKGTPGNVTAAAIQGQDKVHELRHFDSRGIVTYDAVAPGDHHMTVLRPDGTQEHWRLRLRAGEDPWIVERVVESDRSAVVEVVGDEERLGSLFAYALLEESEHVQVTRTLPVPRPVEPGVFENVGAEEVSCLVAVGPDEFVGSATARFDGAEEVWMVVDLDEEPLRIQVSDPEGRPLEGVQVRVFSEADPALFVYGKSTASGEALLHGVPREAVVVNAWHDVSGTLGGLPFDASSRRLALTLDNRARLEVQVLSGSRPVIGAKVALHLIRDSVMEGAAFTGSDGRATYPGLAERTYPVRVSRDGHWEQRLDLTAGLEPRVITVDLPRLGDLVLATRDAAGLAVPGVAVRLTYVPTGEHVRDWIQAGRLEAPSPVTDATGTARLESLPAGTYRWSVTRGETTTVGDLSVVPDRSTRAELHLP